MEDTMWKNRAKRKHSRAKSPLEPSKMHKLFFEHDQVIKS